MKKTIALAVAIMFAMGGAMAQNHQNCPHQHQCRHAQQQAQQPTTPQVNANGIELTLAAAFPEAKSVKKGEKMTEVYDAKGNLLGYGLYSKPASDGIKGYNGETPVLIAFNAKMIIIGVYAMPNAETPGYAKRVADAGFYTSWNGLTVKKALKKKVDTVSGATYTSSAVAKSVEAALKTL